MALEIKLNIEKTESGKFSGSIGYASSDGKTHSIASLLQDTATKVMADIFEILFVITPNLLQDEIDQHHELYF